MPPFSPTKEVRGAIVCMKMADISVAKICRKLGCTWNLVYRTCPRYQETQSIGDRLRSGRPRSARPPQLKAAVRSRIICNHERSMRQMAFASGGGGVVRPPRVSKLSVVELSGKKRRIAQDEYSRLVVRF